MTQQTLRSGLAVIFSICILIQPAARAGEPGSEGACKLRNDIAKKIRASGLDKFFVANPSYSRQTKPFVSFTKTVGFDIGPIEWHRTIDWQFGPRATFSTMGTFIYDPDFQTNSSGFWDFKLRTTGFVNINMNVETCWFDCGMLAWLMATPSMTLNTKSLAGNVEAPPPGMKNIGKFAMPISAGAGFTINHVPPFDLQVDITGSFTSKNQVIDAVTTTEIVDKECLRLPRTMSAVIDTDLEAKARATGTRWFEVIDAGIGYASVGPRVEMQVMEWKGRASPDIQIDFKTGATSVKSGDFFSSMKGPSGGSIRFAWKACIRRVFRSNSCWDDDVKLFSI